MDYPGLTMLASTRLMPELLNAEIAKKKPAHLEKAINSRPEEEKEQCEVVLRGGRTRR
jgi:hypothetical protein